MKVGDLVKYKFSHDNEGNEEPSKPMVVLEVLGRAWKKLVRCAKNQEDCWFDEDTLEVLSESR